MSTLRTMVVCMYLLAAFFTSALAQEKSLYERLGGQNVLSAVVDEFLGIVLTDGRVNAKFAKSDPNRIVPNFKDFFCKATGGPCQYNGLSMKESHKNMGVTEGEFNALVEDLVKALDKFNVPAKEKSELLWALGPLKPQIVEASGQYMTGTNLPRNFKPARPLRVIGKSKKDALPQRESEPIAATPAAKDTTPPKIVITSPSVVRGQGVRPAGSRITITGQATDESGVSEVMVRDVKAQLNASGNFSAEVLLKVGDNQITVTATDIYGNRAAESFTVRRESETVAAAPVPPPPAVTGRYFALVIGNNRYPNLPPERQLKTAIHDAQEVAKLLGADYGFEIKLLTDASREKIIDALNEYRSHLNPDDKLLIYYAGHGHFDNGTGKAYWIPADAKLSSPANWIIADDVTSSIKAIPARHILIVSDSCYSGTLTRAVDFKLSTPAERERYLEKMRGGTARLLMASGGNEPVADGGGSGHSVFARALLDGLRGMSERVFTADELFHQYIKERVAGKSDQTPEYNPLRNSGHDSGDFVFVRVK